MNYNEKSLAHYIRLGGAVRKLAGDETKFTDQISGMTEDSIAELISKVQDPELRKAYTKQAAKHLSKRSPLANDISILMPSLSAAFNASASMLSGGGPIAIPLSAAAGAGGGWLLSKGYQWYDKASLSNRLRDKIEAYRAVSKSKAGK